MRRLQIRVGTQASDFRDGTFVLDIRRGSSRRAGCPLGNPFVLTDAGNDKARDLCCKAYDDLLHLTTCLPDDQTFCLTADEVAAFGLARGFEGPTRAWDGDSARHVLAEIAEVSKDREVLLVCQCRPRNCHGESVAHHADFLRKWGGSRFSCD